MVQMRAKIMASTTLDTGVISTRLVSSPIRIRRPSRCARRIRGIITLSPRPIKALGLRITYGIPDD